MEQLVPAAAFYALALVTAFLAGVLAWVVWKVSESSVVERHQVYEFSLGAIERMKADSVMEVVQAEAQREALVTSRVQDNAANAEYADAVRRQNHLGHFGDMATGRAVMEEHGFDPDDPAAVKRWNASFGEVVS